ncbi:MAG: cysteine hydrolase [Deltaproteobacteria bacterium]|nr:cysteine hydrolase [Deltaproteobacteria bacterium]
MSDAKQDDGNPNDEAAAEVAAFVMAGRPERVDDGLLALAPPDHREAVRQTREILSMLGRAEEPKAPDASVRARILSTLAKKTTRRALVIIDMIKDHLTPGSLLEVPRARDVIPALQKRIEEARASGVPVVYVIDEHDPDDSDMDAHAGWGTHAVKGTPGTEVWDDIAPASGDRIVKKPSYSAFYGSDLQNVLDELKVDTLVLAGCLTEIGLMATATDAMQQGFVVEVPPDTQAGTCVELEMAAMGTMSIMAPYGPARKKRLEQLARAA